VGRASRRVAKAVAFLHQRGGGDFMGPIWARPGRGPGLPLLPRSVDNCLWQWRIVSSGWWFRGRPPVSPFLPSPPRRLHDGYCYMGASPRMPGRRLQKVDCSRVLTVGPRCGGDGPSLWTMWVARSGRWGLLVLAVSAPPRSCVGSSARGMSMVEGTKCREGFSGESPALWRQ
jgi:hypothetical protein